MTSGTTADPWSLSEAALYEELRNRTPDAQQAVMATVVDIEGSAYRRPGAKMVITPEDGTLGAITAGCLEDTVADMAADVLADGRSRVETFDLMDDTEWGLGLGCNGIIDILLEPVDGSFDTALAALAGRDPVTVLTTVDSSDPGISVGDRTIIDHQGAVRPAPNRTPLPEDVATELVSTVDDVGSGRSGTIEYSTDRGRVTVFLDRLEPVPRLLLVGSQNDINPIARLGTMTGFEVVVASPRGGHASPSRFPNAHDVVATHPTNVTDHVDDTTYVVVMSHNLVDDQLALEALLLESPAEYIGLMGPRERFTEIRETLSKSGTTFTDEQLERVSTPVGLDLGGGEPIQIALSVVSEVLAVHNDRSGGRLRTVKGPIHERASLRST